MCKLQHNLLVLITAERNTLPMYRSTVPPTLALDPIPPLPATGNRTCLSIYLIPLTEPSPTDRQIQDRIPTKQDKTGEQSCPQKPTQELRRLSTAH
ncbi:uncharacterized protein BO72DRAFT_169761 [Aspergillus fijiensis CBS 313.89]|uniref:Uncharacterized protein n=1 Tax=Aspergillus fijiensis CBS 313.89 TaxID=1448319 RepID=A0A8G1VXH5_9EURO|nr:uncharacterized protein BO72DRAFT_169761 [Aspergillus fijiensis CBS 313.89]RAK75393.1 hypothetical protein BO72DRAFT_169761 [Aspergillus fijiensis CBS 313.89]